VARRGGHGLAALVCAIGALVGAAPAKALDNGLARTPPMGFNNWNATGCAGDFNERMVERTADLLVSSGLRRAGYEYVNLDDCWALRRRDAAGNLQADPGRFPSGIKALADYVHARGLKLGIYTSAGTKTCSPIGFPGALDHERQDAARFASWGVDYLKYDNCHNRGRDAERRYTRMRDALRATGRQILYSICEWGTSRPWRWARGVGNAWRTTGDIVDSYASMVGIVHRNMALAGYAGPGHWNDPDMLEVGNGGMSATEYRSHFSLWAIMAAPLLIGSDLRKATPQTLGILGNRDVIAVDQDPLGRQGRPIATDGGHDVFVKEMADGSRAVALFNETDSAARIATTARRAGLPRRSAYRMRDLWTGATRWTTGRIAATVPAHGTVMYRVFSGRRAPLVDTRIALADPYAIPGAPARMTTTARVYGWRTAYAVRTRLSAPDGWAAAPAVSGRADLRGAAQTTRWKVAVPAGAAPGTYGVTATFTYRTHRHGGRRVVVRRTLRLGIPAPPPAGTTNLGDATWLRAINGFGPVERNTSNGEDRAGDGRRMAIQGARFGSGLGVHAPSEIDFYLGGRCSSLVANVGVDDEKSRTGSVRFEAWADGAKAADSGRMDTGTPARRLRAALTGASVLRLVVTDGGDGNDSDHGDWAAPRLTC
jgi:alpha-galactosidase